jgi:hypothetical protein
LGPAEGDLIEFWVLYASAHKIADVKPSNAPPPPEFMFYYVGTTARRKLEGRSGGGPFAPWTKNRKSAPTSQQSRIPADGFASQAELCLLESDYIAWRS